MNEHPSLKNPHRLIRYLSKNLDVLNLTDSDPAFLEDLRKLILYLKQVENKAKFSHEENHLREDEYYRTMDWDQLEKIIGDENISKKTLEKIAKLRFSIPSGDLSKSNKSTLKERLQTFIENERTHLAIKRVAAEGKEISESGT